MQSVPAKQSERLTVQPATQKNQISIFQADTDRPISIRRKMHHTVRIVMGRTWSSRKRMKVHRLTGLQFLNFVENATAKVEKLLKVRTCTKSMRSMIIQQVFTAEAWLKKDCFRQRFVRTVILRILC